MTGLRYPRPDHAEKFRTHPDPEGERRPISTKRNGQHTLLWVLDQTSTAMGSRELARWITAPYRDGGVPQRRITNVRELIDSGLTTIITHHLKRIGDLERIVARIGLSLRVPETSHA